MRIVITGHRPNKLLGKYNWVHPSNVKIIQWITKQLHIIHRDCDGLPEACTGMALGIDQMFAYVCHSLGFNYTTFIPCKNQEKVWPQASQDFYHKTLKNAYRIVYVHNGPYYSGCMQKRNIAMRDWALEDKDNVLLAVWNGSSGGTANMIKSCKEKNMSIIYLNPVDI